MTSIKLKIFCQPDASTMARLPRAGAPLTKGMPCGQSDPVHHGRRAAMSRLTT